MKKTVPSPAYYSRQLQLPIFPADATALGSQYSVMQRDEQVWSFLYDMPVFSHGIDDVASFRMFTSSLCDQGHCKLVEVERVCFVPYPLCLPMVCWLMRAPVCISREAIIRRTLCSHYFPF